MKSSFLKKIGSFSVRINSLCNKGKNNFYKSKILSLILDLKDCTLMRIIVLLPEHA